MEQPSANVEIKKKQQQQEAPTPQNTPIFLANVNPRANPSLSSIKEGSEKSQGVGAALANNPQLLSAFQGRLGGLVSANILKTLNPDVRRRVKGLKSIQRQHSVLEIQFQNEILALEKKYHDKYTPLYQRRADFISGKTEPTEPEVEDGVSDDEDDNDKDDDDKDDDDVKVEGIPEFWLSALKSHPQFSELVTDKDEAALKYLVDVRLSYFDKPGFRLDFEFSPNDHFSNTLLTKTYYYQEEPGYGGDFVYDHADGTKIDWKEGKDLTVTVETKKQRHKGTNKTRVVKKTVPAETFFSFFSPPVAPKDEEEAEDFEDEDIDEKLELDYALGEELKDSLIPRAVDWFTGKALQFRDGNDLYDDDFDYEDDEEEEDEDNDDDDDEDDDELPAKDEKTPECKQQ